MGLRSASRHAGLTSCPPAVRREDHEPQHMTRSRFFRKSRQDRANAATLCPESAKRLSRTARTAVRTIEKSPARSGAEKQEMQCVGRTNGIRSRGTVEDSTITRTPVIVDSQIRSTMRPAAEPAYQYRRVLRAEPAAMRRRLTRPRRRGGASVACQRRRSSLRAVLVAAVTTTASPITMPRCRRRRGARRSP